MGEAKFTTIHVILLNIHKDTEGHEPYRRWCQRSFSSSFQCWLQAEVEIPTKKGIHSLKKTSSK